MTKLHLNSDLIRAGDGQYERCERANSVVTNEVDRALAKHGLRLWWSCGDSKSWRVIIGTPSEAELTAFTSIDADAATAREITNLIGKTFELNDGFKMYMELDSDERVNSSGGWLDRIRSEPSREQIFVWDGKALSRA